MGTRMQLWRRFQKLVEDSMWRSRLIKLKIWMERMIYNFQEIILLKLTLKQVENQLIH